MSLPKYMVRLTDEERTGLAYLIRTGTRAASVLIHARILLKADVGNDGSGWDDGRIAEALACGASTVYRVRQAFVERGLEAALWRKKPTGQQYRKLDGAQEARLIALTCGARKRMIFGGRAGVRAVLYMATVAASRCNPLIQAFYQRLRAVGNPPKVALTACMRKLLTFLNAMLKAKTPWQPPAECRA